MGDSTATRTERSITLPTISMAGLVQQSGTEFTVTNTPTACARAADKRLVWPAGALGVVGVALAGALLGRSPACWEPGSRE